MTDLAKLRTVDRQLASLARMGARLEGQGQLNGTKFDAFMDLQEDLLRRRDLALTAPGPRMAIPRKRKGRR